jgi:SAM-dependent methyltransferase
MTQDKQTVVEQYKDSGNLNARIALHDRCSVNEYPWQRWVFDHFTCSTEARILELGCGPGNLWRENADRIPVGWDITLSDFSAGMLDDARRNLSAVTHPFTFRVIDAATIPFDAMTFDAVLANHMLYHVPDRSQTLAEIQRVLKPGGRFFTSTVGETHMRELWELVDVYRPGTITRRSVVTAGFTLENGAAQLSEWFSDVEMYSYEDALVVTEPDLLLAYILSSSILITEPLSPGQQTALLALIKARIADHGAIHITKASGLFRARCGGG